MMNSNKQNNSWENRLWVLVIILALTLIFTLLRSRILAAAPDDFVAQIEQLEAMAAQQVERPKPAPAPVPVVLPSAPTNNYAHDCACPSSASCNCPVGQCHCAQNRVSNRQPMRWQKGTYHNCWGLFRGSVQIGALNTSGVYYPIVGEQWGPKCQPPIPTPLEQHQHSSVQPMPQVTGTWTGGGGRRC